MHRLFNKNYKVKILDFVPSLRYGCKPRVGSFNKSQLDFYQFSWRLFQLQALQVRFEDFIETNRQPVEQASFRPSVGDAFNAVANLPEVAFDAVLIVSLGSRRSDEIG
jgi:hypothetical protein